MSGTHRHQAAAADDDHRSRRGLGLLDQVIAATKQTERRPRPGSDPDADRGGLKGTVTYEPERHPAPSTRRSRRIDAAGVSSSSTPSCTTRTFLKLEGTWRGLHYLVMNTETGTTLKIKVLNVTKQDLFKDLTTRRRVRPEPDLQEDLRERVRHARRRALRRADRRLRVDQPPRGHRDCCGRCPTSRPAPSARSSPPPAPSCSASTSWTRAVQAARPGQDLRHGRIRQVASLPRIARTARFVTLVMPRVLARLPYGAATKPIEEFDYEEAPFDAAGNAKADGPRRLLLDERRLCDGHAADRRLRQVRLLRRHPRRRGRRQGRGPADARLHLATTATWTPSARPRSASPTAARRSCPSSASCRSATTRTPTTRCSSAPSRRRSRRSTTGRRRPPTPRSRPACRTSWRPAAFAHYLKVMARDKIGSFMEASDCEAWLNRWISNYVNAQPERRPGDEGEVSAARGQGRGEGNPGQARAPTTPSPICGPGCSWRN